MDQQGSRRTGIVLPGHVSDDWQVVSPAWVPLDKSASDAQRFNAWLRQQPQMDSIHPASPMRPTPPTPEVGDGRFSALDWQAVLAIVTAAASVATVVLLIVQLTYA